VPLDVEPQVIVAPLEGVVAWVKTPAGTSAPYLFNVPKPCWLGPERVAPGATVHVFGFGLRAPWQSPRLALKNAERHYLLQATPPGRDYRAEDSTLLYVDVPPDAVPGRYDVFVHNGNGAALGWRKAGSLEVIAPVELTEKQFNVCDYGAKGDDEENDCAAIAKALAAAKAVAGDSSVRAVVYFPPGKFRTDTTLQVPSGVTLRGASRDLTVIEGFGVLPPDRKTTALVHPAPHTTLEHLTFQGFTTKGPGAYWMALVNPPPPGDQEVFEDFTLRGCRLYADTARASTPRFIYRQALAVPQFRNVHILDNDFYGSVGFGDHWKPSYRAEFIGNTIHGGGNTDNVSLNAPQLCESIVDSNRLCDAATRLPEALMSGAKIAHGPTSRSSVRTTWAMWTTISCRRGTTSFTMAGSMAPS